ncbi:S9 family peptidase [Thalassotalea sp. LPB0316]|uniref:alpha/beta hydrolase family protein n=1 Tax=Thalassotalea sp. LPB0316 TaxID=2769490 RepID=UPI00186884FB|nr:alpha/beta fold hydrolase [Thalassotalea sp. LPB0316]QOL26243.1 S9 family peptidase [Thalassotalea sp. LPB0316]
MKKYLAIMLIYTLMTTVCFANKWDYLFDSATYHSVKISPDGKHLAVAVNSEGKRALAFISRENMKMVGSAKLPGKNEVGEYFWANNERVVIKINQREPWQEQLVYYGELFAVDLDGSRGELIYGYRNFESSLGSRFKKKEGTMGWADVVDRLADEERHILIKSTPYDNQGDRMPGLYKLNIYNGKLKKLVMGSPVPYADYITNSNGDVKVVTGINKKFNREVHLRKGDSWQQVPTSNFGNKFWPLTLDESEENLFVIDNFNQDKAGLFKLNLASGTLKKIITDKKVDINHVKYTSDGHSIYALGVDDGFPSYYILNNELNEAKVFKGLIAAFPGQTVDITSKSENGEIYIVRVSSDIEAGQFYLYDLKKNKLKKLFKYYPKVKSKQLVYTDPFEFKSSDGLTISGYFTQGKSKNAPLVVLVHGGPHSRDYWEYSADVQYLALNGFSVMQVNFRGSAGFGHNFQAAGYENWGSLIQQDIFEAYQWAIKSGKAKAGKACIMGASFGAYSAVQSAINYPDTYQCAIGYAGVYDLQLLSEKGDIQRLGFGKAYIKETIGTDSARIAKMSPVHHAQQIKIPLMLAHGEEDQQVPYEHSLRLKASLDAANKPYEWHAFEKENHGFFDPDNKKQYMNHVLAFLKQHLK